MVGPPSPSLMTGSCNSNLIVLGFYDIQHAIGTMKMHVFSIEQLQQSMNMLTVS